MSQDLIVAKVDGARRLLAEARDATDAKQVADLARAAEVYARRQRLSEEAIAYATAVKVDALTLMGAFLKANPPRGAGPGRGHKGERKTNPNGELVSGLPQEISAKDSSAGQALDTVKEANPELHEQIRNGKAPVVQAVREVRRQRKREELQARAVAAEQTASDEPSWRLIHGDCLVELKRLPARSVRLVFADPPYNIGVDYGDGEKADRMDPREYLWWASEWLAACKVILADDGSLWVLIGDEYAAEYAVTLKTLGFTVRAWIKWYETFGVNCPNNFNRCSRHLFYCVKDSWRFVFHPSAVNRPSDRQTKYGDARADPAGKIWDDVWQIPRLCGTAAERIPDFPTQLPLDLLLPVVGCASDPGDLVVDPFSGSATAGAACVKLGRRFVGVEKQKRFVDLARQRLKVAAAEILKPKEGDRESEKGAARGGLGEGAGRLQRPPGGDVPRDVPERDRGTRAGPADEGRPAVHQGGAAEVGAKVTGRGGNPGGDPQPPQAGRSAAGRLSTPVAGLCPNCGVRVDDDVASGPDARCDACRLKARRKAGGAKGAKS